MQENKNTAILLGIGNAATDVVCEIPDDHLLQDINLGKGQCIFPDNTEITALQQKLSSYDVQYVPGGSVANVLSCYAAIGGAAQFIGKRADDDCGHLFQTSMDKWDIQFNTALTSDPSIQSTQVYTLVTPDGERSFVSYQGASDHIEKTDISIDMVRRADLLLLDGYMLASENGTELLLHAAKLAKDAAVASVFMPSDLYLMNKEKEVCRKLSESCAAILCNHEQAIAMAEIDTGQDNITFDQALEHLVRHYDWAAVTNGKDGVYGLSNGCNIDHVPNPYQPDMIVSTNGAGDNFAGGFLYGMMHDMGIVKACQLGMHCALKSLQYHSPRPQEPLHHLIEMVA